LVFSGDLDCLRSTELKSSSCGELPDCLSGDLETGGERERVRDGERERVRERVRDGERERDGERLLSLLLSLLL